MHSYIFGLSKINELNKIDVDNDNSDNLVSNYSEIFDNMILLSKEKDEYFKAFTDLIYKLTINSKNKIKYDNKNKTIRFLDGFKEEYFKSRFNKLRELINDDNFFEMFCNGGLYQLNNLITETFGYYVTESSYDCITLDAFIREIEYNVDYQMYCVYNYHA